MLKTNAFNFRPGRQWNHVIWIQIISQFLEIVDVGTCANQTINPKWIISILWRKQLYVCLSCWVTENFRKRNVILKDTLHQHVSRIQAALPGSRRCLNCAQSQALGEAGQEKRITPCGKALERSQKANKGVGIKLERSSEQNFSGSFMALSVPAVYSLGLSVASFLHL